ncbi:MAG: LysR substrate-binding domain-containing protein [Pseudomonadota bacterium]|nr:LysR substrate-binding domain-containing protein [Pseudomonadota bacterium]
MDLRQLAYFVRVAELGSFTRAAQALGVAQPALSRQVRLLEVDLRQSLLTRNGRGAVPTEAGALLLAHARGILHQVASTREALEHVRGGLAGRVALGLPPSVARALAVPLMQAFQAELPEARLAITEGLSASMQEQLLSGRLDVALLYNAQPLPGLELAPLASEELLLVQAASAAPQRRRALPLPELARLPLVIPSRPNAIRMHVEAEMDAAACVPQVALEIDGVAAILDLVAGGAGCALLPRHAVTSAPRPDAFSLHPVAGARTPRLRIALFIAQSALRPATRTQQQVLALVRRLARQRLQGSELKK